MNAEIDLEAYRDQIRGYITHLVQDPVQAEDLVQDTFLKAQQNQESLRDLAALKAWLYRIATNVCRDHFRHLRSSAAAPLPDLEFRGLLEDDNITEPEELGVDSLVERGEMSRCVQKLIRQLPENYRLAILLHDVQGLSNAEAALALGCSCQAAKIQLHRARRRLKEAMLHACDFSRDERGVFVCSPKPAFCRDHLRLPNFPKKF